MRGPRFEQTIMELQVGESLSYFYESSFLGLFGALGGAGGSISGKRGPGRCTCSRRSGHEQIWEEKQTKQQKKIHLSETELTAIPK